MTWQTHYLLGEGGDIIRNLGAIRIVGQGRHRSPLHLTRPRVLLALGITEGLSHVTDSTAWTIGDDIGYLGSIAPTVFGVDVLDDLLATTSVEVDVDVGFLLA